MAEEKKEKLLEVEEVRQRIDELKLKADEMADYIKNNCFGVDASDAFGWDDFYGDMDAYYLISEYKKGTGSFSGLMEAYFTAELDDTDRTVYFMNNRFGVEDSQSAVRKAIYDAYSSDVGIKVLEAGRGLSSYNALRQACCYAFADYIYSQAKGKLIAGSGRNVIAALSLGILFFVQADSEEFEIFQTQRPDKITLSADTAAKG
mgnify:CR=1 FL=1